MFIRHDVVQKYVVRPTLNEVDTHSILIASTLACCSRNRACTGGHRSVGLPLSTDNTDGSSCHGAYQHIRVVLR